MQMDRQLLERLIGAGVLVVALVIVVPAILDGDSDDEGKIQATGGPARSAPINEPRRTHTIRLNQTTQTPPVAREIKQPATDQGQEASPKTAKVVAVDAQPIRTQPVKTATPSRTASKPPDTPVARPDKPVSTQKTNWAVQLGSFSSQQNARRLANEVGGHGFSVFLTPLDRSGKRLYRVRVGPLKTRAEATELVGRLKKLGYSGQVTQ
jgi:DedD protein